jgi:ABC-type dipeptide/oligopeptide/nickel transport system permease component
VSRPANQGGTLVVAANSLYQSYIVGGSFQGWAGHIILDMVYERLYNFRDHLKPFPQLATGHTVSSDLRTLSNCARGVKFHDGTPFNAGVPTPTHLYLIDSLLTGDPNNFVTALKHLAMPAIVLSMSISGFLVRLTRSTLLEALRQDYARTARSKGLQERLVVIRHALRNAILPVVTLLGLLFGGLLGGAAVIETVFAWPGLGLLMVDSINTRDYPQIQGSIGVFAVGYVVVNLLVDLLYVFTDPRIR